MKKFLKAVALATVMCMLLSVSAFAAVDATAGSADRVAGTKTIDVEVIGAGPNNEVALLIVRHGVGLSSVDDGDIMFINQDTADANGEVNFGAVSIKDETQTVDVWVGSAGFQTARMIGENISLADAKKITIVDGADSKYYENVKGAAEVKGGVAAALTVDLDGLTVSKMIWAFKIGDTWKYSKSIEAAALNGSVLEGATQYAVALDAYDENMNQITVSDVAAIFLTTEAADNEYVVGTEDDLMANKDKTK